MQGIFWLAIITTILAVTSASVWLIARGRLNGARARAAENQEARGSQRARDYGGYGSMTGTGQSPDETVITERTRFAAKAATISLAALTALLILASSFWIVGTQNVGIVRSFGKPVGTVSNGPQWTYPWEQVTDMDYSVQVTDFTAAGCQIQLRLADGQTACAKVGVRWQINTRSADLLFRRYKGSTAGVENGVLIPALQTAANEIFGDYDPVALLSSKVPVGKPGNPSVPQLATRVQALLNKTIGSEVSLDLLNIPNITYPTSVQARMNTILQQKASTIAAQLAEQTANAQAAANRTIAASVSHDPNVLTSRCLDLMAELIKNGQVPPVNMCNLSGSGSSVIVGK